MLYLLWCPELVDSTRLQSALSIFFWCTPCLFLTGMLTFIFCPHNFLVIWYTSPIRCSGVAFCASFAIPSCVGFLTSLLLFGNGSIGLSWRSFIYPSFSTSLFSNIWNMFLSYILKSGFIWLFLSLHVSNFLILCLVAISSTLVWHLQWQGGAHSLHQRLFLLLHLLGILSTYFSNCWTLCSITVDCSWYAIIWSASADSHY